MNDDTTIEAYPLQWPAGRTRTKVRGRSRFGGSYRDHNIAEARDFLLVELGRLDAREPVISSNLRLRRDGLLAGDQGEPDDPGVAVYFRYQGKRLAFVCDRWNRVADNLWSIGKTIEAIRGINRWGTGEMVVAALSGFRALPPPQKPWRMVFGYGSEDRPPMSEVEKRYRLSAATMHPDRGGNPAGMAELNAARDDARAELGGDE